MVDPGLWAAFALASLAIGLVPGPGVGAILGYAIGSGERAAFAAVGGLALGNLLATGISLAGMGVVLAASPAAFLLLQWAGALYLVVLGLLAIRRSGRAASLGGIARPVVPPRTAFLGSLGIGTFHPKTIVFMAAFGPQFVSRELPYAAQAAILAITFALVCAGTDSGYALLAGRARRLFRSPRAVAMLERLGGGALVIAGVATALTPR